MSTDTESVQLTALPLVRIVEEVRQLPDPADRAKAAEDLQQQGLAMAARLRDDRDQAIHDMAMTGIPHTQIGRNLGLSRSAIHKILARFN